MSTDQPVSDTSDQADASTDGVTQVSRRPECNSVSAATGEIPHAHDEADYGEQVAEAAADRVEEFIEKYPELAYLPVCETPGRDLRSELVEVEWRESVADAPDAFDQVVVDDVERAESLNWAQAMWRFLVSRQPYDDGIGGRFRDTESDETFFKEFRDCWTMEYGQEQAARNMGAQRQLMGGEYPPNCPREELRHIIEEDIEWSGDTATIVLTRTGSSVPNGERLPPVDFSDRVTRTWTKGVYDTVRNICEYELGLEPDQWGFVRGDDVHGIGVTGDEGSSPAPSDGENAGQIGRKDRHQTGANACYPHAHDAIYIDLEETDLRDDFETDVEVKAALQATFYEAIEKHLELCDIATREAHQPEDAVRVRLDLQNPSGYATEYLRLDEREMMEMPVEFQAFGAIEWATQRQRIGRSQVFTEAAKADKCVQDPETVHAAELRYDRSGHHSELVCVECESPVGVDAETLAEQRCGMPIETEDGEEASDGVEEVTRVSVGESPEAARVRREARDHVEKTGEESVALVMAAIGAAPQHREVVAEAIDGKLEPDTEIETGVPPPDPSYELEAVVMPDGGEEEVGAPGGGGVSTTQLVLPEQRLLEETRLQFHGGEIGGEEWSPKIICEDDTDRFATYSAEAAAGWLVENGFREPWHAELTLSFGGARYDREELPTAFETPAATAPPGVGTKEDGNETGN